LRLRLALACADNRCSEADASSVLGDVKRVVDAGSQQVKAGIQAAAGEVAALGGRMQQQWQAAAPAASASGPAASTTTTAVHREEKEFVTTGNPKPGASPAGGAAEER